MDSFLLIGQSNMAGRGELDEESKNLNPRIFVLRNGRWQHLYEPVSCDRPLYAGACLATTFAKQYVQTFDRPIGLIPCADGGTPLSQWQQEELLYDHALAQTRLAMRTSTLCGILWHQGESDSQDTLSASNYEIRLHTMLHALLDDLHLPGLPVVLGELGSYLADVPENAYRFYPIVNEALRHLSQSHPHWALAESAGLACKPDGLHFDTPSLRTFGYRYFDAFLSVAT